MGRGATDRVYGGNGFRDQIVASWQRSREAGVDQRDPAPPYDEQAVALESKLAKAAAPVLEGIAGDLRDSPLSVVLADNRGRVVRRLDGDEGLAQLLDTVSLAPGFDHSEHVVGTNAIGMALRVRKASTVVGDEHYAERYRRLAGSAAPVHDPLSTRILGVLAVLGRADQPTGGITALARQGALAVERRLDDFEGRGQKELLLRYLEAARDATDPVFAVSADALHAAPHAMRILGGLAHGDLWPVLEDSLASREADEVSLELPDGDSVSVRVEALRKGGQLVGAIGEVRRSPRSLPRQTVPVLPVPEYNAWSLTARRAAVAIRAAAQDLTPVCVVGEAGVGKRTMVRHVAGRVFPARNLLVLEPKDAVAARVGDELRGGTHVLVRHVEELAADRLLHLVETAHGPSATGWLALTLRGDTRDLPEPLQASQVVVVDLPPLRNRPQDIEQALPSLLRRHAGNRDLELSSALVERLRREAWPTNFHGIDLLMAELVRAKDGRLLEIADLPVAFGRMMRRRLTPMEWLTRTAIVQALEVSEGNKAVAAETLGISRASIYRKIKALGIAHPDGHRSDPGLGPGAAEGAEG